MKQVIVFMLLAVAAISCKTSSSAIESGEGTSFRSQPKMVGTAAALAPMIIYKTTGNYDNLVPVTMDETKTRITSYPAPGDLYYRGVLAMPQSLMEGYLLDRRGISANTVFTDYTYQEYAAMDKTPSIEELMSHIKYKDPFVELYRLKSPSSREISIEYANDIIKSEFQGCEIIIFAPNSTK